MTETAKPLYTIFQYGDTGVYKVVKFKFRNDSISFYKDDDDNREVQHNDKKLQNNLARSKSTVLQISLCNPWEHFVTFTLDKEKYNRYDLKKFKKDLSKWIQNEGKKYGQKIKYLYIPEQHKDGAWHAHGLLHNVPDCMVTEFNPDEARNLKQRKKFIELKNEGYKNIPEYANKFGFVSIGAIKNHVACGFYISKYITKAITSDALELGVRTYYDSLHLKRATVTCDVYYEVPELDKALKYQGDFCAVGIVQEKRWDYGLEYAEFDNIDQIIFSDDDEENSEKTVKFENQNYEEVYIDGFLDLLHSLRRVDRRTGEYIYHNAGA